MTPPTPHRRQVVIATPEPLGHRRAGPAVRAIRMAETIAASGHEVVLASTAPEPPEVEPVGVRVAQGDDIPTDPEVAVVTGRAVLDLDWLVAGDAIVAVDLYDPFQLEALHRGGSDMIRRIDLVEGAHRTLAAQLTRGDMFFCANERQRRLWLGYLGAFGRLNPATHDAAGDARALIDLAPFGVDVQPPRAGPSPLRRAHDLAPDVPIALWAGGLHEWLDPVTALRAVAWAAERCPVRLVVVAGRPGAEAARDEADRLGLTGERVFFHESWVPHDERGPMLLDATLGLCAHGDHLETEFSHRTRFLDHLWAGLPTVTTGRDPLSIDLARAGAALVTPTGDPEALGQAIVDVVSDHDGRQAMCTAATELGEQLRWPTTLRPLVDWVEEAAPAADRRDPVIGPRLGDRAHQARSLIERVRMQWSIEGAAGVARRAQNRLGRTRP